MVEQLTENQFMGVQFSPSTYAERNFGVYWAHNPFVVGFESLPLPLLDSTHRLLSITKNLFYIVNSKQFNYDIFLK